MKRIKYKSGYKYQLHADYTVKVSIKPPNRVVRPYITLSTNRTLLTRRGYAWDGPSGPTFDTKNFMRASLVHDALYQLMRQKVISRRWRLEADKELKRICLEDGMSNIRAGYVYRSVRRWAGSAASSKNKKKILTAP